MRYLHTNIENVTITLSFSLKLSLQYYSEYNTVFCDYEIYFYYYMCLFI